MWSRDIINVNTTRSRGNISELEFSYSLFFNYHFFLQSYAENVRFKEH